MEAARTWKTIQQLLNLSGFTFKLEYLFDRNIYQYRFHITYFNTIATYFEDIFKVARFIVYATGATSMAKVSAVHLLSPTVLADFTSSILCCAKYREKKKVSLINSNRMRCLTLNRPPN